jgi:5-methyltetrahydrofolate--homocysteine methyltransferase
VDAICIETMTDLQEAILAVQAAKSLNDALPVFASMTFDPTPRGFRTIMGVSIPDATAGLAAAGADVVGSNCGYGSEQMLAVAREFRAHSTRPILIQSNAGLPETEGDRAVYRETPEFMAEKAREMAGSGVAIIGGCCGTTPAHIRAIRLVIDAVLSKR